MKNKIVGIVILMLVATTVVSATNINLKKDIQTAVSGDVSNSNNILPYEPTLFDWWNVDQKQTVKNGYGLTLYPPTKEAQSFTPTKNKLTAVSLYLFKVGTPLDSIQLTVAIRDNLTGSDLATKTIDTNVVTIAGSGTWVLFDFEDISITPESTYYIVCSGTAGNITNNYCWFFSKNDTYTRGNAWEQYYENPWYRMNAIGDFCFKTYFRKPLDSSIPTNNVNLRPLGNGISQASMGGEFMETQKLLAADGAGGDNFGYSLVIDGDTAIIASMLDDDNGLDSGSAYVFTRTGATWTQQQKLNASDGTAADEFGWWVDLDGDTAVITALMNDNENGVEAGAAYVFTRSGTTWTQQAKLIASDGQEKDHFGYCADLLGDTVFIGANWDDDNGDGSGSMYVFTRSGTTWTQQQKLLASDGQAGDRFGGMIALSEDTALIGAYWDDDKGNDSGSMYVFTRNGTTWTQQAKILASDGAAGDALATSISLDGDTAIVNSPYDDDNGVDSGSAYVFTRTGTTWTEQQKLLASDGSANDAFGSVVALDGDTALIGAMLDDDMGLSSGSAYVFTRTGTTWTQQQKLLASDGAQNDQFGIVVLDGDTALISSWYDDDMGPNSGSVYVFTKTGLTFSIAGGLGVSLKITNTGTTNAYDVPWWIHVEGGILGRINKTANGTVDVPAGELITIVKTGLFFGFGPISIIAKVANEEQTATGTQLIIFSMVKK